ncbi:sigma 54-interacting transcriptional regulator [Sporosalibacterium faouarense]|uniref:sigma 54-interacting transcriptional regulator n=1 Tax=Sporosalibacterium faouarense TaxID=516123 RepID=UPI00192B05D5|nr:sigma-54-dependent transcriptional regulator [Sporosalibacterium faouarense]
MKKIDEVYNYIKEETSCERIKSCLLNGKEIGVEAKEIEEELGIIRNNASTLLNTLTKDEKLIKINSRPVKFIATDGLACLLPNSKIHQEYSSQGIYDLLNSIKEIHHLEASDPFKALVGSNSSLKTQIDQAKAAIMYPPNGLHTLIIGPSGVGKTTFANTMYLYAKKAKNLSEDAYPFISFNCSDYYNNPQLLLSQLFGHVKGAFTGADMDKVGLVEKANGGILFLDEVHRLPPDGQEMLFYLMDNGEFHRLGETENARKSDVLIIAATTEDPQEVLLKTFLRRIPVIISLAPLSEKDIGERMNIIENLFIEEAIRINRKLIVSSEVLKALVIYECKGNIGQLKSDIKLICARAFLRYLQSEEDLKIEFDLLPKFIKDSIFNLNKLDTDTQEYLNIFHEDMSIYPSKKKQYDRKVSSENVYIKITERLSELKEKGLSQEKIDIEISKEIENYFKNIIKRFNYQNFNVRKLYKILDKVIVDFTVELINFASNELNKEFDNRILFSLAFHLNSLIERVQLKKPIVNHELSKIREIYNREYQVASLMVKKIEEKFSLSIPIDENGFIAILLANSEIETTKDDKIGVLIISHGNSTASSMASVCNRLLNSDIVKAIDMPLEKDVGEVYQKALAMAKAIDKGKGVIILVDMGSLKDFGRRITDETGIVTRTIHKVSTPLVLETLRKVLYKDDSLDEIYFSIADQHETKKSIKRQKAIMTVCATGKGTSIMLKNILLNILQENDNNDIKIITMNYMAIKSNTAEYKKLQEDYEIICCVGNIKPKDDLPFFSMEDVMNKKTRYRFYKFIESKSDDGDISQPKSCYDTSVEMLEEYSLYINPKKAVIYIREFINDLNLHSLNKDKALITNLTIHLGFMIERVITGQRAIFDDIESFITKHSEEFSRMRKSIVKLEKVYNIDIADDELCYALQVINGNKKYK